MTYSVLLRILTKKSRIFYGKYEGVRVGDVLNLGIQGIAYLRWSYYNQSMISFSDEILDEIKITTEFRINKPGKDGRKLFEFRDNVLSEEERILEYRVKRGIQKDKIKSRNIKSNFKNNKKALQLKNQGHR